MPYVRTWDASSPLGSEDADLIDDFFREKLTDIEERLNTIIGADGSMSDDPVIPVGQDLSSLYTGVKSTTGVERTVGWYHGTNIVSVGTIVYQNLHISVTGASGEFHMLVPVTLPVGVTVTQARARVYYNNASHTIDGSFFGVTDSNLNYSQTLSTPSASASPQWMTAAALTHVTVANQHYGFSIRADNNNASTATELRLYSVQVYYTHPGGVVR